MAALRDANSVTPVSITRASLPPTVSGPARKALLAPLAASTTALPVPTQPFSADWMREVSGGLDSAELLNCRLLVASDADNVAQVAGNGRLAHRAGIAGGQGRGRRGPGRYGKQADSEQESGTCDRRTERGTAYAAQFATEPGVG